MEIHDGREKQADAKGRITFVTVLTALLFTICISFHALAEGTITINTEAWSWEQGMVNSFDAIIDTAGYEGQEITVEMLAEFVPEPDETEQPVFVYMNGKRISKKDQNNRRTVQTEETELTFTGNLTMPDKGHCTGVKLTVKLTCPSGETIRTIEKTIVDGQAGTDNGSGKFFIPVNPTQWALYLTAAALVLWGCAILRSRILKNRKTGE